MNIYLISYNSVFWYWVNYDRATITRPSSFDEDYAEAFRTYVNSFAPLDKTKEEITLALIAMFALFSTHEFPYDWAIVGATFFYRVYDKWIGNETK